MTFVVKVTHPSGLHDEAEAEGMEAAVFAARTLYDEARAANPYQGFHRQLAVTVEHPGGAVRIEGRRP